MTAYRFKAGTRIKSPIASVMSEIRRATVDGNVSLQDLVDNAKPKDAPLHCEFEWHNPTAANKWRLEQARKIIQSVEFIPNDSPPVRGYHSVEAIVTKPDGTEKQKQVFRSVQDILACPESRADLLLQAIRDVQALRKKYAALQELAQVWAALDKTLAEVKV